MVRRTNRVRHQVSPAGPNLPRLSLGEYVDFARMDVQLAQMRRHEGTSCGATGVVSPMVVNAEKIQGEISITLPTYRGILGAVTALWLAQGMLPTPALSAWEPTRPVEFIVPAGTGGGADQMARTIQGIVTKHQLMKQSMVVINKSGGAGGEGFLDIKTSRNNPHKLVLTLSNLFTTPLATGIPFSWKDITPVAMMALDEFILWVNAETPYKSVKEYIDAAKKEPGKFKMGGTGSKQEDQIITVAIEKATGAKFTYIP